MSIGRRKIWKACVVTLVLVGTALPAYADSITITSGTISLGRFNLGDIAVRGDGASIRGNMGPDDGGTYEPALSCFRTQCGDALTLSMADSVSNDAETLGGSIVLNGVEYGLSRLSFAILAGPVSNPGFTDVTIRSPFTFAAILMATLNGATETFTLRGQGTAIADYGSDGWFSTTYAFAEASPSATPEPASLLLLGSGLAGVIAHRRRAAAKKLG